MALHVVRIGLSSVFFPILCATAFGAVEVWAPRLHNPAFTTPGGKIVAEVRGDASLSNTGWSVSVSTAHQSWKCTNVSAQRGRIHHQTQDGWLLTITIPPSTPPELLDMTVAHTTGGSVTVARSVSVVRNFEESFYVLQLSDEHVTKIEAIHADGTSHSSHGNGSADAMRWASGVVNLMNPRFAIFTGDNNQVYNSGDNWAGIEEGTNRLKIFVTALGHFRVPTPAIPGNHDIGWSSYVQSKEWRDVYERVIGARAFSFRMGTFYVLTNEWTYNEYLTWAKAEWASSRADKSILFRLIGQHFYDGLKGWTTVSVENEPCDMMVVGHNHSTQILQTSPYVVVSAPSALDHQKAAFYEFQRTASGWTCPQRSNHAEGKNVFTLVGDWGASKLSVAFSGANDGSQQSITATVTNSFPIDFYTGRVTFIVRKGTYTIQGGSIESQYDDATGKKTVVLARVNIAKNAITTVSIRPSTTGVKAGFAVHTTGAVQNARTYVDFMGRAMHNGDLTTRSTTKGLYWMSRDGVIRSSGGR